MPLLQMIYVSSATYPMSEDDLKSILSASRRNNPARGITGMLLYQEGYFIQAIEGEEQAVHELYYKIELDPRHRGVLKLTESLVTKRSFGQWAMGFNHLSDLPPEDAANFSDFLSQPKAEVLAHDLSRVQMLLEAFRDRTFF